MAVRVAFLIFLSATLWLSWVCARRITRRFGPQQVSAVPLAVFRIVFGLALLGEVFQLRYLAPLLGSELVGVMSPAIDLRLATLVWGVVVLAIVAGYRTRLAAIVNYAFTLTTMSTFRDFEYHVDYVFTLGAVFLIFAPVSRRLSIDRLRELRRSAAAREPEPLRATVSFAWSVGIVLVAIAFVYADSTLHKVTAPLWTKGLGMWLPASVLYATWVDLSFLLDNQILSRGLGYLTLAFEFAFVLLMWWRRMWLPLFVVGLGLHVGILVAFPIPWFAIAVIGLYAVMVPPGVYAWLRARFRRASPAVSFVFDGDCPLCRGTRAVLGALDVTGAVTFQAVDTAHERLPALRDVKRETLLVDVHAVTSGGKVESGVAAYAAVLSRMPCTLPAGVLLRLPGIAAAATAVYRRVAHSRARGDCGDEVCAVAPASVASGRDDLRPLTALICVTLALQIVSSTANLAFTHTAAAIGIEGPYATWRHAVVEVRHRVGRPFFGITAHGVFMSHHFVGRRMSMTLAHEAPDGTRTFLPITQEDGRAHPAMSGRMWVYWNFRVVQRVGDLQRTERRLARVAGFFGTRAGFNSMDSTYVVLVKEFTVEEAWKAGVLAERRAIPWREWGRLRLADGQATLVKSE